jgi:hypothetical protein
VSSAFDDRGLREIEATQQELKESIEHSRALAEKSQRLLDRHRADLERGGEAGAAGEGNDEGGRDREPSPFRN